MATTFYFEGSEKKTSITFQKGTPAEDFLWIIIDHLKSEGIYQIDEYFAESTDWQNVVMEDVIFELHHIITEEGI